jgi:hypothetical protein
LRRAVFVRVDADPLVCPSELERSVHRARLVLEGVHVPASRHERGHVASIVSMSGSALS